MGVVEREGREMRWVWLGEGEGEEVGVVGRGEG